MRRVALLAVAIASICGFSSAVAHAQNAVWQRQLALPSGDIQAATFASRDVVWAAAAGGIFRSADRGHSWAVVYNSGQGFSSIAAAPDGLHGWAVGGLGIATTDDGGMTWQSRASGTQINLATVAAIDNDSAMAAGWGTGFSDVVVEPQPHVLLRTDDGGASWSEVRVSGDYRTIAIDFLPEGRRGWMAVHRCVPATNAGCGAQEDALLMTDDGGASWTPVSKGAAIYRFSFVTSSVAWSIGVASCSAQYCPDALLRTTDGGLTWKVVRQTAPNAFYALDERTAIVAEGHCENSCSTSLLETEDAGMTWHEIAALGGGYLSAIQFSGRNDAVALGFTASARWSDDRGHSWHDATFPVVVGSGAFDFVDTTHGWFAASKLLRTTDGGSTWTVVSDHAYQDIDFVSITEGWAVLATCGSVCRTTVARTVDGGATWQRQFDIDDPNTARLVFNTPADGWLVFDSDGRALHTRDGGTTWSEQALPTRPPGYGENGRSVFVDARTGWAAAIQCAPVFVDCRSHAYVTKDGGDTWSPTADFATDACSVHEIAAIDASHLWINATRCSGDHVVYRSSDGGASWDAEPSGWLRDLKFFSLGVGRAMIQICDPTSCSSSLVRTSDGGVTWSQDDRPLPRPASRTEFVSPEHVWALAQGGGGLAGISSQTLYEFAGSEPAIAARTITSPDTGSSTGGNSANPWSIVLVCFAAGCAGLLLLRHGASRRRRWL